MQPLARDPPLLLFLIFATCTHTLAQHVRYVRTSASPPQLCPDQPCLTIDQYTRETATYFTAGATFVFLPGYHTPQRIINLASISNLTLRGDGNYSSTYIVCNKMATVVCNSMTGLSIKAITFILDSTNDSAAQSLDTKSVVRIWSSAETLFSNLSFLGIGGKGKQAFISSRHSSMQLTSCIFKGSKGRYGGAILAYDRSMITLDGCLFTGNMLSLKILF